MGFSAIEKNYAKLSWQCKIIRKRNFRTRRSQVQKNMNWTTEIKIKLVKIDNKKQSKSREFMKRVNKKLD